MVKFLRYLSLTVCTGVLAGGSWNCGPSGQLPIYGERNAKYTIVDGKTQIDTVYKTIPPFRFLNQDSVFITNQSLSNRVYVADFFFTSCPTICPVMQRHMASLSEHFQSDTSVYFLSFTIDPLHDTPGRLKHYQQQLRTKNNRWYFLTGNRDSIYALAEKGYFATAKTDSTAPGGFIHSGGLILVDAHQRIRGIYDGTIDQEVDKLAVDIKRLREEVERK